LREERGGTLSNSLGEEGSGYKSGKKKKRPLERESIGRLDRLGKAVPKPQSRKEGKLHITRKDSTHSRRGGMEREADRKKEGDSLQLKKN